jgi:hypothetical protein
VTGVIRGALWIGDDGHVGKRVAKADAHPAEVIAALRGA